MANPSPSKSRAKERYDALVPDREPFLRRARECAALTVPYIMPPAEFSKTMSLPTPYQSVGARGVRTLASKLLLALYPPNTPFFKYVVDDLAARKVEEAVQQKGLRGEIEKALSARERAILTEAESAQFRPKAFTALQHLLVTGNFLFHVPRRGGRIRSFRLDQYVVRRAPNGDLLEIVTREAVSPGSLPPEARRLLGESEKKSPDTADKTAELYTHVYRTRDEWVIYQEIDDKKVPGSDGTYKIDEQLEWLPLRISEQPGESYGRPYVEEFLGDLDSLEGLAETIVAGSAAAARILTLVDPTGTTSLKAVTEARTGDVRAGNASDVTVVQANKQADLQVARQQVVDITQGLAAAFLMNQAFQRQGERVTAEEIRTMAAELDAALGGIYSFLGPEFQLPMILLFEARMERRVKAGPLPEGFAKPTIVTGIEAIGRGADQRNLKLFVAEILQVLGPENAFKFLNGVELMKRAAANYGIDTAGLIPDEDALQQQGTEQMLQQLIEQLGPNAINQAGGAMREVIKGQMAMAPAMAAGQPAPVPQGPQ